MLYTARTKTWGAQHEEIDKIMIKIIHQDMGYKFTGLDKQKNVSLKLIIFSYPSILTYVLGAQKKRLIETFLLSTHNICFG